MKRDVQKICDRFITCRQAKYIVKPYMLYTPLLVHKKPWVDIYMDFILGLPRSRKKKRLHICYYIDIFSKMIHFIVCYKTNDAINIKTFSFETSFGYMVFLGALCLIEMLSFLVTFGRFCWVS